MAYSRYATEFMDKDNNVYGVMDDEARVSIAALQSDMEKKANTDGSYSDMTVGNAEQLVSTVGITDKVPYNFRTSGGSADIGDREEDTVVGGTVAWNQLINTLPATQTVNGITFTNNGDGTITANGTATAEAVIICISPVSAVIGHVYCIRCCPTGGSSSSYFTYDGYVAEGVDVGNGAIGKMSLTRIYILIRNGYVANNLVFKPQMFDLTAMFGSTIADYLYTLETATAGAGVAWFKKLFPKSYYAYNAGTLMHVQTSAHEMTGFNQWDEEWESGGYNLVTGAKVTDTRIRNKNLIPVFPNTTYYGKNMAWVLECDDNGDYLGVYKNGYNTTFTTGENTRFLSFETSSSYGTTYNNDVCINLHWDGERDGEYEPYKLNSYPLDSDLVLRGILKLDADNKPYFDGDVYKPDGTVTRRYGVIDMGTLSYTANQPGNFYTYVTGIKPVSITDIPNILFSNGIAYNQSAYGNATGQMMFCQRNSATWFTDDRYSAAADFKTAMSGVYLVYELAEPTTETADPYQTPQIVNDWGTEEYVYAGTGDVAVPVGHETVYRNNLRAKLEMAPDSPSEGNGDYVVRQTNGVNEYVPLVIPTELPANPTESGNYILKATVSDGTTVLSWEVQA